MTLKDHRLLTKSACKPGLRLARSLLPGQKRGLLDRALFIPRRLVNICAALGLFMILCLGVVASQPDQEMVMSYSLANKVIAVDAGHGGFDPGAKRDNITEDKITLAISKLLQKHLSEAGSLVVMVREDDRDLSDENFSGSLRERKRQDLTRRAEKANQAKAKLYVSIHANADPSPRWRGAQVFYDRNSEEGKRVAVAIQEELTRILGNTKRKALPGSYYITQKTEMPAVIVEVGFISNPEEGKLLMDPDYQAKVAYAIYAGIAKSQSQSGEFAIVYP
ncbi:MAG TPA: N-acetylmuramoyl-L-alanine amidase CwlD [Syntrophomonadaceae bacterium]|nr:N-acetylmuramoyl-L-alanine amidase CwlD [Syntrophomonadaceae bacterium]HQE23631.1 N-acetylmuramoyl-L-alanine amidase CwlD [Syntrophomonadaceae bacterium]